VDGLVPDAVGDDDARRTCAETIWIGNWSQEGTVTENRSRGTMPTGGMLMLVAIGAVLGLVYNAVGLKSQPVWGIPWIGEDRLAVFDDVPAIDVKPPDPTISSDPLAGLVGAGSLPQIVNPGRPVPVTVNVLKAYVDHGSGALIVDARDPDEYAESHIPGAVNMPYEEVVTDPERIEAIETGGQPIIIYCGGPECEISRNLALDFYYAGLEPVAFYEGGLPEWIALGYPLVEGAP